jgi:hypothetical protein
LNTNTVRPELVEGLLHQTIDSINLEFDREFEKLKNFVTQLKFNKKFKKEVVPILLAYYALDNLQALFELKTSRTVVPLYTVLRSVFEATFKIRYLVNDSADDTRGKEIEFSSLDSKLLFNKRWHQAGLVSNADFDTLNNVTNKRIEALGGVKTKPNFEQIVKHVCSEDSKISASWYGFTSVR